VDAPKQSDLEVRNLAVDTIKPLTIRIAIFRLQHVSQATLRGAFDVHARVHRREGPVPHPHPALPLFRQPEPNKAMLFPR
jgi:hypothetical protein